MPTKQWPHVGRHKTGEVERVLHLHQMPPGGCCCHSPPWECPWKSQHRLHMHGTVFGSSVTQSGMLGRIGLSSASLQPTSLMADSHSQIVGRVWSVTRSGECRQLCAFHHPAGCLPHCPAVVETAFFFRITCQPRQRRQIAGLLIHITGLDAEIDTRLLALNVQRRSARKAGGSGCAPPMPPRPAVKISDLPGHRCSVDDPFHEGFIGALHDALATDITMSLPSSGRTSGPAVELMKMLGGSMGTRSDWQSARAVHPRRVKHTNWFARLHQQVSSSFRSAGFAGWPQNNPSCAQPCQCRHKPQVHRGFRPLQGPGCFAPYGKRLQSASFCR